MNRWNTPNDLYLVHQTQVFSGGACNVLNTDGELQRSRERDSINDWLTHQRIILFDPQIHPETHGTEYDFAVHQPIELAARRAAKINLYEISPHTFGGITCLEIASDHFRWEEPMVIYFSDGDPQRDTLPAHSKTGHPLFAPLGIGESEAAMRAHYKEFRKNGNNMRKYLMSLAREMPKLTVAFGEQAQGRDIVITPERMHAADLLRAVVRASEGERVYVLCTGGDKARDEKGNPVFMTPENPAELELKACLDQYVDEGNELRRTIAELIHISVFTRVVYSQRAVLVALEELLRLKGVLPPESNG